MLKKIFTIVLVLGIFGGNAFCEDWEGFIKAAERQSPSRTKRQYSSGKRLLQEKRDRLLAIDAEVPMLMSVGNYDKTEAIMKEALGLTIEIHHGTDIEAAERFMQLGILYLKWDRLVEAEDALKWCIKIGEREVGPGDIRLANAYRFLAVAYYSQGKYALAEQEAEKLFDAYVGQFGLEDPRTQEAKDFMKDIYKRK